VGELSLTGLQAKLLRVLQERRDLPGGRRADEIAVDVLVSPRPTATSRPWSAAGLFRQDLYFRLHVVNLRVPPLRERMADVPLLAKGLLARICQRLREPAPRLDPAGLQELVRYDWPGNVRELENLIERYVALHPLGVQLRELVEECRRRQQRPPDDPLVKERKELEEILARHGGHRARAAQELGITRRALTYRLQRAGLTRPRS
jgi:DNA-binding NtrC family response regulator